MHNDVLRTKRRSYLSGLVAIEILFDTSPQVFSNESASDSACDSERSELNCLFRCTFVWMNGFRTLRHNNRIILYFIETGVLRCILYCIK